jgi:hypothetical protein
LIRFDYPGLSEQEADQVKHALRRETDEPLSSYVTDEADGEGDTPQVTG